MFFIIANKRIMLTLCALNLPRCTIDQVQTHLILHGEQPESLGYTTCQIVTERASDSIDISSPQGIRRGSEVER